MSLFWIVSAFLSIAIAALAHSERLVLPEFARPADAFMNSVKARTAGELAGPRGRAATRVGECQKPGALRRELDTWVAEASV